MRDTMSQKIKELDIFRVYKLLDHPVRKEIIELLGEHGRLGFKELKEKLRINVGALYYHFDVLGDLLTQDENRKYILTDLGRMAYQFLTSEKAQLIDIEVKEKAKMLRSSNKILRGLKSLFWPSTFFIKLYESPKRHVADAVLILILGSWFLIEAKVEPILFFFNTGGSPSSEIIIAKLLTSLIVIVSVSEVISRIFFKRSGGVLCLFIGVSFSLIPLFIFPVLLLFENSNMPIFRDPLFEGIIQFFLQVWSLCILTSAISLSKGFKAEKAAIISLTLVYVNLGYLFFILR